MSVKRIYVEKRSAFRQYANFLLDEARNLLGIKNLLDLRIIYRYDVEEISDELFALAVKTVFSEPPLDHVYENLDAEISKCFVFAVELLPGQFDQRAESAAECIQLTSASNRPVVKTAVLYLLYGDLNEAQKEQFKNHMINPVESREASLELQASLFDQNSPPTQIDIIEGFRELQPADYVDFRKSIANLAMDDDDLKFCQNYFCKENRDPTFTELRVIDTYWSDHCRHTTFNTILDDVKIEDSRVNNAYKKYLSIRKELGRQEKPITLMDMATIGMKYLYARGKIPALDISEEINACSVKINVDVDGLSEPWLLMFKNETHNHPTEIEPFGGAATCIGGAIRDPLSGRSYVYNAMRITGGGDPTVPISSTLKGKLPQRKIAVTAAEGFSSYGNQIGLATSLVDEIYHPGYIAKRMEIGAVIGAAPLCNVRREKPAPGDVIILIGGRTGRDGIGGATGSSMAHGINSLEKCGAQVQKGNAPEERKLQRLFRDKKTTKLIKRCNDFGAGGICVAVGELARGLEINLDKVPKKYEGLNGTELAISESQERMALVIAESDAEQFLKNSKTENLEATVIAKVTSDERLKMFWNGKTIVDVSRSFLDSAGAIKNASAVIFDAKNFVHPKFQSKFNSNDYKDLTATEIFRNLISDLRFCSKKGLAERFDSTIGANTVLMPYGGIYQKTPAQVMVAKLPTDGESNTCSGMSYGFDPYIMEENIFDGAYESVAESAAKLLATGFSRKQMWLSFQEYFERLGQDPCAWGKPTAALLGALMAQIDLNLASIGGKDSMSGSFESLNVPSTLVSFSCSVTTTDKIISPEFKRINSKIALLSGKKISDVFDLAEKKLSSGQIISAWAITSGGIAEGLCKMCFGNRIGISIEVSLVELFSDNEARFIFELAENVSIDDLTVMEKRKQSILLK